MVSRLEGRFHNKQTCATAIVRFQAKGGRTALRIEEVLDDFHIPPREQNWSCSLDREIGLVSIKYHHLQRHHRECLVRIADIVDVVSIERDEERLVDRM